MMRILSFEKFAFGCVVIILAVFALGYGLFTGEIQFVTCGILLSFLAAVNIYLASRKPSPAGMVDQYADERDRYVAMKSATATLKVLNILFFTAGFVLVCLFGLTKELSFLAAGVTLWAGIAVMVGTLLVMNLYYEKRL